MKKTKDVSDEDEYSADDPEEVEAAGSEEEWAPDGSEASESVVKKRPQRNAAKKRTHSEEDEEEEEEEDDDDDDDAEEEEEDEDESDSETEKKPKRKRRKNEEEEEDSYDEFNETGEPPKDYTSGAFVIAKDDLDGDNDPTLWRIDGKALLQKYLPFKEDSKTLYKSTSTYSGWSINNKEKFLAAQVTFKVQNRTETIVELQTPIDGQQEAAKDDKEN